ncbi:MAG: ribosome silencing factor [Armatimonadetes bacterium]|nr:ribosome silencing factor [Armatimonadota bacterium]
MSKPKSLPSVDKAELIREYADDMKALEIEVLDVRAKTSVTDYFVVCTATSDTHLKAVAERVAEKLRDQGIKPLRRSAVTSDGWILFDYGDVVLHVFLEEKRQFYDLESLWENLPTDPILVAEES